MTKFYAANNWQNLPIATTIFAAIVIVLPAQAQAKSSEQIYQIAQQTAVQINADFPGALGGSGVIIDKQGQNYTVLTANHVACLLNCRPGINYTVRTPDGQDRPVTEVRSLPQSGTNADLAIVTFQSPNSYEVAVLGDSEHIIPGSQIYIFGYPASGDLRGERREAEFTSGMVTSRPQNRPQGYNLRYDAVTKSGMSGGPVFDSEGRLVGIHGQGDTEGETETSTGSTVSIKTGFNAGIPIQTFLASADRVGMNPSRLNLDRDAPKQKPAVSDNPTEARDYNLSGLMNLERGDIAAAIADFTQALGRNPDPTDAYRAYFNRGNARIRTGDYSGAIADWTEAMRHNSTDSAVYFNRGLAHYRQRNWQAAVKDTSQAIQRDPNNEKAYLVRGDAKVELGDQTAALADYDRAIAIAPNYAIAYNNRATIRVNLGDREGALEDLRRAAPLLLDQGKNAQYQTVMNNIAILERHLSHSPSQRPSQDPNLAKLQEWGLTPVACTDGVVSILFDGKEYCTQPTDWLGVGRYQYIPGSDRLEPMATPFTPNNNPPTPAFDPNDIGL